MQIVNILILNLQIMLPPLNYRLPLTQGAPSYLPHGLFSAAIFSSQQALFPPGPSLHIDDPQ